jgi:hypothetical protein
MKKLLILVSALVLAFTLAACDKTPDGTGLESVTLNGVADFEVEQDDVVDLLDGITAIGSDDVDYSEFITVDSDDCTITDGMLDTSVGGTCTVTYSAVVEGKLAREVAVVTVTIPPLPPVEGPTLIEWDFEDEAQLEGWNIYTANGGSIEKSIEDGAMKLVTTSGGARYETRLDYQGLPLEQGYAYEMTFKMKSDIDGKKVHINFGELLPADPWFIPFKTEGIDIITLSTEWQEFTISFMMELDNQNGGPLFEMGNMDGSTGLDATIWVDDFVIVGGSGTDTIDPTIEGAEDLTIFVEDNVTFDPMEGVTATDYPDVDLTEDIIISGDTVDPLTPGTYYVYYVVYDASFNSDYVRRIVTVENDTEAPVITGLDAIVLTVGTPFDELEGVAAVDNRDGDVTANIVLGGDTLDVNVAGVYNVTYTVSDAAGNEAVETRMITITDMIFDPTDTIQNGEFDALGWMTWSQDWDEGAGIPTVTKEVVAGELVVDTDLLGNYNWSIQLFQEGVTLVEGNQYQISFDAYAETARDINFKLIDGNAAEFLYVASLTDTLQTFTYSFTYDGTSTEGKLDFELGVIGSAVAGFVVFDNIKFEDFDGTAVVADTDQVVNGTFDLDNSSSWGGWYGDEWSGYTTSSFTTVNGLLEVTVEGVTETHASYATQIFQEGFAMEQGETYLLSFDAMAADARQMNVNLGDALDYDPWFINFMDTAVVDLTTDWQTFEILFTMTEASTTDQGKLVFELGAIGGVAVNTVVSIDNVKIEKLQQEPVLLNEDFETTGWGAFVDYWWWSGAASEVYFNIVNGEMEVDIVQPGGAGWAIQPNQVVELEWNETENVSYKVTFDAYADAERTINAFVGFQRASDNTWHPYGGLENVALTTTPQSFEYMITVSEDNGPDNVELKFECGGNDINWYFDNVTLVKWDTVNDLPLGDSLVVNGTFDQPVEWGAWFGDEWSGYTDSTVTVVDGVLVADVNWADGVTPATYATQVYQEGLTFRQGVTYTLQFDAYADAEKTIKINIGEPLTADPWFTNFMDTADVTITTTNTTYFVTFTMTGATNENGKLVFELATDVETVIYIDNVMIYENHN